MTPREWSILFQIARHEAGAKSAEGITNIVWVVLNRVQSTRWPNDIESVVFQRGQFTRIPINNNVEDFVKETVIKAVLTYYLYPEKVHDGIYFHASGYGLNWTRQHRLIYVDPVGHHIYAEK